MDSSRRLAVAMAEECRCLILSCEQAGADLPGALRPERLVWMCDQVEEHVEQWPVTRLHRCIGFIQCAMLAHKMLRLDELTEMFDTIQLAQETANRDLDDLRDHLDPKSSFEFDLGGEA